MSTIQRSDVMQREKSCTCSRHLILCVPTGNLFLYAVSRTFILMLSTFHISDFLCTCWKTKSLYLGKIKVVLRVIYAFFNTRKAQNTSFISNGIKSRLERNSLCWEDGDVQVIMWRLDSPQRTWPFQTQVSSFVICFLSASQKKPLQR